MRRKIFALWLFSLGSLAAQDPFSDAFRRGMEAAERQRQFQQMMQLERQRMVLEQQRLDALKQASPTATVPGAACAGPGLFVIAPSISTGELAREIVRRLGIAEVRVRCATEILVVVRSELYNPLNFSYENVSDLKKDAEGQLNISGSNFHVYAYSMDDDLRVMQTGHYQANAEN